MGSNMTLLPFLISSKFFNLLGSFPSRKNILHSLIETQKMSMLMDSVIWVCRGKDSESPVFGFLIECYSNKGLIIDALEVKRKN